MKRFRVPAGLAEYTVTTRHEPMVDGDYVRGSTDSDRKQITLNRAMPREAMILTFWHEAMHAILHELGEMDAADNEAFVEAMAQNIARAVRALPRELL